MPITTQQQCRVRIEGTYNGKSWVYEDAPDDGGSQYLWPDKENGINPSEYWWSEGNYSCDCNRRHLLPPELQAEFDARHTEKDRDGEPNWCGHTIRIDRIIPIDPDLARVATLNLNESTTPETPR